MDPSFFERSAGSVGQRPTQRRSQTTVERIKQAALTLFIEEGYAHASTNRIAQRAGVNIASLYRYFPNRESIVLALYEEASDKLGQLVHDWLPANLALPPDQTMRGLLDLIARFMDHEQVVLLRLHDEVAELRAVGRGMLLDRLGTSINLAYLQQQFGQIGEAALRRKLYFVQNLAMSMISRYVIDRPAGLTHEQFVDELTVVILAYLHSKPLSAAP